MNASISRIDVLLNTQLSLEVVRCGWIVEILQGVQLPLIQLEREGRDGVIGHAILF